MEKVDSTVKAVRFSGDRDKFPFLVAGKKGQGISFRGEASIEAGKALSYDRFQPFSVSISSLCAPIDFCAVSCHLTMIDSSRTTDSLL